MSCDSSCANLTAGLDPSCDALKKVGGVTKRIWVGQLSVLDGYTVNANTLDIESITLCSDSPTNTLKKFIGRKLKNSKTHEVEVGENINVINQAINMVLYHNTSLEMKAIEDLINAEDCFCLYETNAGQIEVIGIDTRASNSSNDPIGGLNCSAGTGGTGVLLNDSTATTITLSGQHRVIARVFNIATDATLQENIDYLDAISE